MNKVHYVNAYEKTQKLGEKEFKRITGVTREIFEKMIVRLKEQYAQDHSGGGAPGQPVELRLTLALEYWREYRTFEHMSLLSEAQPTISYRKAQSMKWCCGWSMR